jgi:mono/diheme cytochrome c family protein
VKKFIIGLILGLLIPALAGYVYLAFGFAPIATSAKPMPFEETAANMIIHAHMNKEAPKNDPPIPADEANLTQGAAIYADNCAFCHGVPDTPATKAAKGMFPLPPQLFSHDEMVTDDPTGKIYWKVKNGIRMTGMPGFGEMLTDAQMWQVSLLLKNADKISPTVKSALTKAAPAPGAAVKPETEEKGPKHVHDHHDH